MYIYILGAHELMNIFMINCTFTSTALISRLRRVNSVKWWAKNQAILYINLLNTKRRLLYLNTQFVPRSKHFSSRL